MARMAWRILSTAGPPRALSQSIITDCGICSVEFPSLHPEAWKTSSSVDRRGLCFCSNQSTEKDNPPPHLHPEIAPIGTMPLLSRRCVVIDLTAPLRLEKCEYTLSHASTPRPVTAAVVATSSLSPRYTAFFYTRHQSVLGVVISPPEL